MARIQIKTGKEISKILIESINKAGKITQEAKKLRDVAFRRIEQLKKIQKETGWTPPALESLGGKTSFSLTPRNKKFMDEVDRLVSFLNNAGSTRQGAYIDLTLTVKNIPGAENIAVTKGTLKEVANLLNKQKWELESRLRQYLESGSYFLSSLGSAERQDVVDNYLKEVPNRQGGGTFEDLLEYLGQQERAEQTARELKGKGTFIIPE